jgi:hypothetical protein
MTTNIILDKNVREKKYNKSTIWNEFIKDHKGTKIIESNKEDKDNKDINIEKTDIDIEKKGKHPGGRPAKKYKYENERNNIITKLNEILGITNTNNIFYLSDIDNDVNKQNQIIDLENDSKLYLNSCCWSYFTKDLKTRKYLSLLRSIYKDMKYDMIPHCISHFVSLTPFYYFHSMNIPH